MAGVLAEIRRMFGSDNSAAVMPNVPVVEIEDLPEYQMSSTVSPPYQPSYFTGDKWDGAFGVTQLMQADYWTLRKRSAQLFAENLYARGLIRRLITNEINTGLSAESTPNEKILGVPEDSLNEWTEDIEARFELWGSNPAVCDYQQAMTFGALQRQARMEALVTGDVLVVLRLSQATKTIKVQLIDGNRVLTPMLSQAKPRAGHKITEGVETDSQGRVVAYWVQQDDSSIKRLPAYGEKSGRLMAWLVFGTDKRLDEVRGQPILSLVLQSMKEIDRHRDAVQRKKALQAVVAMFIEKTQDKPGSLPLTGGAVKRETIETVDSAGSRRQFNMAHHVPGLVIEELQQGEKINSFGSQNADDNFGAFEDTIISAIAWANEIPPEILKLAFTNNYSASQAAINEFKIYLNKFWQGWGETFCGPIHREWLLTSVMAARIAAPGLLDMWRDPAQYEQYGAYTLTEWYGQIKPSTDVVKQAKGATMLLEHGLTTHTREARNSTGTCFAKNVKRLKRENELLAGALEPMAKFNQTYSSNYDSAVSAIDTALADMSEQINDLAEAQNGS